MRREHEVAAGPAVRCGESLLVPVIRVDVTCMADLAYTAEAALVGVLLAQPRTAPRWLPLQAEPEEAASWQDWLARRPRLLAELGARLQAATQAP